MTICMTTPARMNELHANILQSSTIIAEEHILGCGLPQEGGPTAALKVGLESLGRELWSSGYLDHVLEGSLNSLGLRDSCSKARGRTEGAPAPWAGTSLVRV